MYSIACVLMVEGRTTVADGSRDDLRGWRRGVREKMELGKVCANVRVCLWWKVCCYGLYACGQGFLGRERGGKIRFRALGTAMTVAEMYCIGQSRVRTYVCNVRRELVFILRKIEYVLKVWNGTAVSSHLFLRSGKVLYCTFIYALALPCVPAHCTLHCPLFLSLGSLKFLRRFFRWSFESWASEAWFWRFEEPWDAFLIWWRAKKEEQKGWMTV